MVLLMPDLEAGPFQVVMMRVPAGVRASGFYQRLRNRRSFLILDSGKVFVFVAMDLERRQELRVVVLRSKTKMGTVVLLDDSRKIVAVHLRRALHPVGAMIVGGHRQRPIAEH